MTAGPRVTIVIPTYNRAALVVEAIESVLGQSYRDLEVIVSDDGSDDDTALRVQAFGAPVRYLGLEHAGRTGRTRNRGIEAARGELIALLDDDDLWEPDKLAKQVKLLDRDGLDLVYTDRRVEHDENSRSETAASVDLASPDRLLDPVSRGQFPHVCSLLVRRALLQQVGGFDETLETGEDMDMWLRLAPIARAGRVPEPLLVIRRRPGSLSEKSIPAAFRNAILVMERALAAGGMSRSQRWLGRATVARYEARLATVLTGCGELSAARRTALRAVRHAPASREAWVALARAARLGAMRRP